MGTASRSPQPTQQRNRVMQFPICALQNVSAEIGPNPLSSPRSCKTLCTGQPYILTMKNQPGTCRCMQRRTGGADSIRTSAEPCY